MLSSFNQRLCLCTFDLIGSSCRHVNQITVFHLEDKLRPHAVDVISSLRKHGQFRTLMLTGDHDASAERVARDVGISEVYSGLKPEDKLQKVKSLSGKHLGLRRLLVYHPCMLDVMASASRRHSRVQAIVTAYDYLSV